MPYLPLTYRHAAAPCPTLVGRTGETKNTPPQPVRELPISKGL